MISLHRFLYDLCKDFDRDATDRCPVANLIPQPTSDRITSLNNTSNLGEVS